VRTRIALALAGYAASIYLANWLTTRYGLVPAGFGLLVTAGTYTAGLALALRDVVQDLGGFRAVFLGLVVGALLSLVGASGRIAVASMCAFLLGELLDLVVYTPLRKRSWSGAVAASNLVGAIVDTYVFLTIAGFPVTRRAMAGQLLVKVVWVTGGFLIVGAVIRRVVSRNRQRTEGAGSYA
jgi:uncharacterized PurR-regulated membrane protein YhhQ (DUF165 family)